uniref:Uncharacterized protein n=1 Tax=Globodera rostochiensis TaxID=31243 RepID=A0A914HUC0_GLORO
MDEIKMSKYGEQTKLAKEFGISKETICRWKKEFGLPVNSQIIYSNKERKELMKKYYKIKQRNSKISDFAIANFLNIDRTTLQRWKKQCVNSVDEHSLPENAGAVQDRDTFEHSMPSSDDNLWAWNLAKKQRTQRTELHSLKNCSALSANSNCIRLCAICCFLHSF